MTTELKQLAEKAAKFLGGRTWGMLKVKFDLKDKPIEYCFFESSMFAPIMMHLAKREMEKRGWKWKISDWYKDNSKYNCQFSKLDAPYQKHVFDSNEFIAFWTALLSAIGEKK